ncbi:MAG TPA: DUF1732 domain-containing protein [Candidatus Omnitrophica bacterium]|nr:MAG: hypothetical protein DRP80_01635 [Candidatus Omnitrophota bacterium]HEC69389.1 DUF1732 domain-containing protein [Candidatus Omnitrophota bacterium]
MIRSMTGFVFKRELISQGEVRINLRSTNFKYLDVNIPRIPVGLEVLEKDIFRQIVKKIKRGRIEVNITTNFLDFQNISSQDFIRIKKIFSLALRELLEFKKIQGQSIRKEIEELGASLKRRIASFKKYLRRKELPLGEDILEEVSLISFYLSHLNKILSKKEKRPGKILDFLSQELLREINTVLAKVKDKKLSLEAVYFKEEVDRLRELAQNIE